MRINKLAIALSTSLIACSAAASAQRELPTTVRNQTFCYKARNGAQTVCLPLASAVKAPAQLRVTIPKAGGCGGSSSCGNNNRVVATGLDKRWIERRIDASPQFKIDSGVARFGADKMTAPRR